MQVEPTAKYKYSTVASGLLPSGALVAHPMKYREEEKGKIISQYGVAVEEFLSYIFELYITRHVLPSGGQYIILLVNSEK